MIALTARTPESRAAALSTQRQPIRQKHLKGSERRQKEERERASRVFQGDCLCAHVSRALRRAGGRSLFAEDPCAHPFQRLRQDRPIQSKPMNSLRPIQSKNLSGPQWRILYVKVGCVQTHGAKFLALLPDYNQQRLFATQNILNFQRQPPSILA